MQLNLLIYVAVGVANGAHHDVVVILVCLNYVQHLGSYCPVLSVEGLLGIAEVPWLEVSSGGESSPLGGQGMQAVDAEEALEVLVEDLASGLCLKFLKALVEVECCHVERVRLGHIDEVNLELLVELLPKREALVLGVCEELEALPYPQQGVQLQEGQEGLLVFQAGL